MISTQELIEAFDTIGARVRIAPLGMDFRVQPSGEPGIEVMARRDDRGGYFEVRINYTRIVDLGIADLDTKRRRVVLSADDWGETIDAPPRVFICETNGEELSVETVTEPAA